MRRTVVPVIAAAALALGACSSNGDEPEPTVTQPTGTAPTTTSPQPTDTAPAETQDSEPELTTEEPDNGPTDETEEPAGAEFSTEEQRNPEYPSSVDTDGDLFATGVRAASHDGYERVVFDFEGTGTPGWSVRYVEEAIADESNQEVDLDGAFILMVSTSGVTPPITDGELDLDQMARGFYDAGQADLVQDVYVSGIFEGWSSALIGLDERAPFRVFTLTDPTRLVVDISTEND